MHAFLLSLVVIFVAELGDKSQLMAMAFATRYKPLPILIGITIATAVVHAVSVLVGVLIGARIPTDAVNIVAGLDEHRLHPAEPLPQIVREPQTPGSDVVTHEFFQPRLVNRHPPGAQRIQSLAQARLQLRQELVDQLVDDATDLLVGEAEAPVLMSFAQELKTVRREIGDDQPSARRGAVGGGVQQPGLHAGQAGHVAGPRGPQHVGVTAEGAGTRARPPTRTTSRRPVPGRRPAARHRRTCDI